MTFSPINPFWDLFIFFPFTSFAKYTKTSNGFYFYNNCSTGMRSIRYKDLVHTFKPVDRSLSENPLFAEYKFLNYSALAATPEREEKLDKIKSLQLSIKALYWCNQAGICMLYVNFHWNIKRKWSSFNLNVENLRFEIWAAKDFVDFELLYYDP